VSREGKKYHCQKEGGVNIVFGPKYGPLTGSLWVYYNYSNLEIDPLVPSVMVIVQVELTPPSPGELGQVVRSSANLAQVTLYTVCSVNIKGKNMETLLPPPEQHSFLQIPMLFT
jgi:hypothetical protein